MGPYSVYRFQMLRMHQKSGKLITVQFKAKQNSDAHIVNSSFHRAVHGLRMVAIIVFRPCRMELFIAFFMIGLLKKNICADTGIL